MKTKIMIASLIVGLSVTLKGMQTPPVKTPGELFTAGQLSFNEFLCSKDLKSFAQALVLFNQAARHHSIFSHDVLGAMAWQVSLFVSDGELKQQLIESAIEWYKLGSYQCVPGLITAAENMLQYLKETKPFQNTSQEPTEHKPVDEKQDKQ